MTSDEWGVASAKSTVGAGLRPRPDLDFRLYLISDRRQVRSTTLIDSLTEATRAGVRAVQLREKDLPARQVYEWARQLVERLDPFGARVLINDRADVAVSARAHGVHLPAAGLPARDVRAAFPALSLIASSTHSLEEARRAEDEGVDFITVGPVYETPSKRPYGPPLGIQSLARIAREVSLPVFAIGGITPDRVAPCIEAGAHGVAVISGILGAEDLASAVQAFLAALGSL